MKPADTRRQVFLETMKLVPHEKAYIEFDYSFDDEATLSSVSSISDESFLKEEISSYTEGHQPIRRRSTTTSFKAAIAPTTIHRSINTVSSRWIRILLRVILLPCLLCKDHKSLPSLSKIGRARIGSLEELIHRGHSHNDYHQSDPLFSSLKHGIKSIEVDVFPRNDDLWVAHTRFDLNPDRTIHNLYIEPLLSLFRRSRDPDTSTSGAGVSPSAPAPETSLIGQQRPFPRKGRQVRVNNHLMCLKSGIIHLLVDFKGDADKSAELLQRAVGPLRPYLSRVDKKGRFHQGKITVLISGNRPKEHTLVHKSGERFLFLDGRQRDIRDNTDTTLVPMVSLPWRDLHLARVLGRGEQHMKNIVQKAHEQGKRIRIWGAPNHEEAWLSMVKSNIDLVSVDDHPRYLRFVSTISRP